MLNFLLGSARALGHTLYVWASISCPEGRQKSQLIRNQSLKPGLGWKCSVDPFLKKNFIHSFIHSFCDSIFHRSFASFDLLNQVRRRSSQPLGNCHPPDQPSRLPTWMACLPVPELPQLTCGDHMSSNAWQVSRLSPARCSSHP